MGEGKKLSGGLIALIIVGVLLLGGAIIAIIAVGSGFGVYQQANTIKVDFEQQKGAIELNLDKGWKLIKQKAQVSDQYVDTYKDIMSDMTKGRYENGTGQLMATIQESNPNIDLSILKELGNTIEGIRNENEMVQKKALSLQGEYNKIITGNPMGIILHALNILPKLELLLVTSGRTKEAVRTGEDNDVSVFDKKEPAPATPADTAKKPKEEVKVPAGVNLLVGAGGIAPAVPAKK